MQEKVIMRITPTSQTQVNNYNLETDIHSPSEKKVKSDKGKSFLKTTLTGKGLDKPFNILKEHGKRTTRPAFPSKYNFLL